MAAEPSATDGVGSATVYFITGASRGLGLEMVKQLLSTVPQALIVAACRAPEGAKDLQALAAQHPECVHIIPLDTTDENSVKAAVSWVDRTLDGRVDVLINNAGVMGKEMKVWHDVDVDEATALLRTNVIGPLLVAGALLPALRKGRRKMIANVSSGLGSLTSVATDLRATLERLGGAAPTGPPPRGPPPVSANAYVMYKASKSALNMEMLIMARDLAAEGFIVVSLQPGWVATDMGNASAANYSKATNGQQTFQPSLKPEDSVAGMLSVLHKLTPKDTGGFFAYDGSTLPW